MHVPRLLSGGSFESCTKGILCIVHGLASTLQPLLELRTDGFCWHKALLHRIIAIHALGASARTLRGCWRLVNGREVSGRGDVALTLGLGFRAARDARFRINVNSAVIGPNKRRMTGSISHTALDIHRSVSCHVRDAV
jgi:hypothetical protein